MRKNFMNNEKILEKEIDLIQNCITRMGQNSFSVKGWLIALIIAIIALLSENVDIKFVCMIIIGLTGVFWILDAFYLRTEKLYRWKYDWVIKKRKETLDFCYDLNPYKKEMWLLNEDGTGGCGCLFARGTGCGFWHGAGPCTLYHEYVQR